jgi:hypothetical protein
MADPDDTIIHFKDLTGASLKEICNAYARAIRRQELNRGRWHRAIGVPHDVRSLSASVIESQFSQRKSEWRSHADSNQTSSAET